MTVSRGRIAGWVGVGCLVVLNTVLMFGNGRSLLAASILWGLLVAALVVIRTRWFYRAVLRGFDRRLKAPEHEGH